MYDRTSNKTSVNETRKQLFAQKGRAYDAIPPTRAAVLQHTNRAAYQAGHCWGQELTPSLDLPSPGDGFSKRENGSLSGRRFQM